MKTLEARARELAEKAAAKDASDRERSDREGEIAGALGRDIEQFALKAGITLSVATVGNVITVTKDKVQDVMTIKVTANSDVALFSLSTESGRFDKRGEDEALEIVLKWLS